MPTMPRCARSCVASIAVSGLGLLVVLPGALFAASRPRRPLHGDARFANAGEVARAGLLGRREAVAARAS